MGGKSTWRYILKTVGASPRKINDSSHIEGETVLKPHQSPVFFFILLTLIFFPKMETLNPIFIKNPPGNLFFFDECPGVSDTQTTYSRSSNRQHEKKRLEEFEIHSKTETMKRFSHFFNYADGKVLR